uniref:Uncharacterized protein n=1 Tax=Strongyloides stercoralis TaxID=6248 RepID=A0A0K0EL53_STRER
MKTSFSIVIFFIAFFGFMNAFNVKDNKINALSQDDDLKKIEKRQYGEYYYDVPYDYEDCEDDDDDGYDGDDGYDSYDGGAGGDGIYYSDGGYVY